MKKKIIVTLFMLAAILAACATGCSSGKPLENVALVKDNKYSCTFEDVKHDFVVCLPEKSKGAPLVILLHGAGQSADSFKDVTQFDKEANARGYAVCYVTGSINVKAGRNSVSWDYGRIDADFDDVGFIKALVSYLCDEYSLDDDNVYAAGFSNGGFMNFRLALEAQDTFKACVSVAGDLCKTLWNKRPEKNDISFMEIYGEKDESMPKNFDGSAGSALDPAIEDVMEYMASSNGLGLQNEESFGKGSLIQKYGSDSDGDIVWSVLAGGIKHAWPTEEDGGLSTNKLILDFYESVK